MADKNYTYQLSTENSYNINDLVGVWESGWEHLKKFTELQFSYKPKVFDESEHYLWRLLSVIDDVLCPYTDIGKQFNTPDPCPKYIELLNLAASDESNPYAPVIETEYVGPVIISLVATIKGTPRRTYREKLGNWSKDKEKLKKTIKILTAAFTKYDTVEGVLSKIADNKNLKLFKEIWSKRDFNINLLTRQSWAEEDYLQTSINPQIKEAMKWLGYGTKNKNAFIEAWWNCLWLFMKPKVEQMQQMQKFINEDKPIYRQDIEMLQYYLGYGRPVINFTKKGDAHQPEIILKPKESELERFVGEDSLKLMSIILLVQPAFELSQQFQHSFPKPRSVVQCHAPSCMKYFYTYRNAQVVCGGSKGNKKTKCALEWQQYRYWLECLNKNPMQDWNNPKRIKEFLSRNL